LAASVFVAFDHLRLFDLLARFRIMRPDRDLGGGAALICIVTVIMLEKLWSRRLSDRF
jgi:hypothetical protein